MHLKKIINYILMFTVLMINKNVYTLRTFDEMFECCVDLLLISNENNSHYVLVKSLSKFRKE